MQLVIEIIEIAFKTISLLYEGSCPFIYHSVVSKIVFGCPITNPSIIL